MTNREQQVMDLADLGYSIPQIAGILGLSKSTVYRFKSRSTGNTDVGFDAMIRKGSQLLLEAIKRECPERFR